MATVKGNATVIKLAAGSISASGTATDISIFCNTSDFPRTAEALDITTYGKNSKVYTGGLKDGTFTCGGVYDNAATNTPRTILEASEGVTFVVVRRPEGTTVSKPQQVFTAVLTNYSESNPVAGIVAWTADFQLSDDVNNLTQ